MVELILSFIRDYWFYVPTVMAVASIIAKATPNTTDDKYVMFIQKIIDAVALSSTPTTINKIKGD